MTAEERKQLLETFDEGALCVLSGWMPTDELDNDPRGYLGTIRDRTEHLKGTPEVSLLYRVAFLEEALMEALLQLRDQAEQARAERSAQNN